MAKANPANKAPAESTKKGEVLDKKERVHEVVNSKGKASKMVVRKF